jgi:transposase
MVAWENGRHYRQVVVRELLAVHLRLEAHRFPRYCPELNPDEGA